jgi:hypothetical protein
MMNSANLENEPTNYDVQENFSQTRVLKSLSRYLMKILRKFQYLPKYESPRALNVLEDIGNIA